MGMEKHEDLELITQLSPTTWTNAKEVAVWEEVEDGVYVFAGTRNLLEEALCRQAQERAH
jgi:hypothetical protein